MNDLPDDFGFILVNFMQFEEVAELDDLKAGIGAFELLPFQRA